MAWTHNVATMRSEHVPMKSEQLYQMSSASHNKHWAAVPMSRE